jgi:protein-L-isoaspartate O-methyltransferase
MNGQVFTVSSNKNILDVAKRRVDRWSPLAKNMKWVPIESVAPNFILDAFSSMERFHAIIYCGAIPELNLSLEKLLCVGGTLIVPVEGSQEFQLLCRRSATNTENVKIMNLLFIFEDVP